MSTSNELLAEFRRVHTTSVERARAMLAGLDAAQANWKVREKSWSVLECIEHLSLTLGGYAERTEPALVRARDRGRRGAPPYGKGTFFGRFLIRGLRKGPAKRKAPAPGSFKPKWSEAEPEPVLARFEEAVRRQLRLADMAEGLALGEINVASPVSRLLRLSVAQAFELHTLHTPRHLDQAERVTREPGFPNT